MNIASLFSYLSKLLETTIFMFNIKSIMILCGFLGFCKNALCKLKDNGSRETQPNLFSTIKKGNVKKKV